MSARHSAGSRRLVAAAIGLLIAGLLAGCVGSVDRDEFDAEIQRRGGGIDADRLLDALVDVTDASTGEVVVRDATVTVQAVTVEVSPTERLEEVDRWFAANGLQGPDPASNLDPEELDAWFTPDTVDPPVIENAIDTALLRSELREPWAQSLTLAGTPGQVWAASLVLTNDRASEVWTFGPDGDPVRQS